MNQTKNYGLKKPEVSEFFKLADWNENFDKIDSEIKSKEDKIEEIANTEFTVADKRENIASKEKMPKILGKIAKWFSDLKTVAFSGSYNDLSDKPIVDANISSTSTNPVQNKVVKNALDHKLNGYTVTYTVPANTGGWHKIAQISDYFNFDLYTSGGWYSAPKSVAHFQIQNIHGKIRIVQLSGKVLPNANNGIAKIRMVRVSDDVDTWILEEYSPSSINPEAYTFIMAGNLTLTPLDGSVDSTTSFKDSVSLDVIDITTGYVITTGSVDSAMSDTSEHPVQNKVIKSYVDKKASENVDFSTSTSKLLNGSIEAPLVLNKATKNFMSSPIEQGNLSKDDGAETPSSYIVRTAEFIPVDSDKRYVITFKGVQYVGVHTFDSNKAQISDSGWKLNNYIFSAENNCKYVRFVFKKETDLKITPSDVSNIMLTTDLNTTSDDFVPYDGYEIKSCGKNLFDARILNTTPTSVNSNTKYSVSEGSITVSAVSKDTPFVQVYWRAPIEKLGLSVGDKVFFSIEIDTSGANINGEQRVYLYQLSNENDGSKKVILSPGKEQGKLDVIDDTDIILLFRLNQNTDYNEVGQFFTVKNIQIEKSSAVTNYEPYKDGGTVHIDSTTEFPLLGLKSFDGETNIISPGNVEVTYAKSDSGAAIVDTLKKSVSDGKTKVANAITGKGVKTATDATFDVMAENISKIDTELHGATLSVVTSDKELFGKTVTLTRHYTNVGTTVFSNNGTCSFIVQQSGPYTITCGEAHKDISVTNIDVLNKTTISVNLLLLKIVTFASGTDEEIAKMIQAHYNNKINIADYWAVGDTRSVSLSAMTHAMVGESHRAQTVRFVIADFEHDTLANGIGSHSKAAITLLQDDCLMNEANMTNPSANGSNNTENGYMSSRQSNEGGWNACARRGWCNDMYFHALPTAWRSMVKTVNKKTSVGNLSSTIKTDQDKIFLPSEIEIFGSRTFSFAGEGAQYQYYKNAIANRYKAPRWTSTDNSSIYFTRSPCSTNNTSFCVVSATGEENTRYADATVGIAPMLCI